MMDSHRRSNKAPPRLRLSATTRVGACLVAGRASLTRAGLAPGSESSPRRSEWYRLISVLPLALGQVERLVGAGDKHAGGIRSVLRVGADAAGEAHARQPRPPTGSSRTVARPAAAFVRPARRHRADRSREAPREFLPSVAAGHVRLANGAAQHVVPHRCNTRSPKRCPCRSLSALKPSRSSITQGQSAGSTGGCAAPRGPAVVMQSDAGCTAGQVRR